MDSKKGQRFSRLMYLSRVIVYLLCLISVIGTLFIETIPTIILWTVITLPLLWPHIAYGLVSRTNNLYKSEYRLFHFDSCVCGFMLPILGTHSLATLGIFNICMIAQLMVNGPKGLLYHLFFVVVGIGLKTIFVDFTLGAGHTYTEVVFALPLLIAGPALLGLNTYFLSQKLSSQRTRFREQSELDGLTGLYNRTYFEKQLSVINKTPINDNVATALIIIDIDDFKQINDTFGHDQGDSVICQFANIVTRVVRQQDTVARYGGEEFVVLVPNCTYDAALGLAQRIRQETAQFQFKLDKPMSMITVSIGIAVLTQDEDFKSWFKRADSALYTAKQQGKNQVVAAA